MNDGHKPFCRRRRIGESATCSCGYRPTPGPKALALCDPHWIGDATIDGARIVLTVAEAQGIRFRCLCTKHDVHVWFANPLSAAPVDIDVPPYGRYRREGLRFDELSLEPEIIFRGACALHLRVKLGQVVPG